MTGGNVGEFGEWPWIRQIYPSQILVILKVSCDKSFDCPSIGHLIIPRRLMNIEQIDDIHLGTWQTTCSMWLISFFMATASGSQGLPISHSQIDSSPSNGLVHKLLYLWYPRTIEFNSMKTCTFSAVFMTFDTANLDVNVHYVLWNIFLVYFHSENFTNLLNFLLPNVFMQWIRQSFPLSKFPSIRYMSYGVFQYISRTSDQFSVDLINKIVSHK